MVDQSSRPSRDFYALAVAMVLVPAITATVLAAYDSLVWQRSLASQRRPVRFGSRVLFAAADFAGDVDAR